MLRKRKIVKVFLEFRYGHLNKFVDVLAAYLYVACLLAQACSVTVGAGGLATISGQHYAILDLVLALLQHTEEVVNAGLLPAALVNAAAASVP